MAKYNVGIIGYGWAATAHIDAINACRVLVAGEPPLDRISVFEAIELAKAWKAKL